MGSIVSRLIVHYAPSSKGSRLSLLMLTKELQRCNLASLQTWARNTRRGQKYVKSRRQFNNVPLATDSESDEDRRFVQVLLGDVEGYLRRENRRRYCCCDDA